MVGMLQDKPADPLQYMANWTTAENERIKGANSNQIYMSCIKLHLMYVKICSHYGCTHIKIFSAIIQKLGKKYIKWSVPNKSVAR